MGSDRLLGIPMGFRVSFGQRWEWVVSKLKQKLLKWQAHQSLVSSRAFVLNHYLLPSLIYFLACWTPARYQLNQIFSLARNTLWGGDADHSRAPKVAWDICCLPKKKGTAELKIIRRCYKCFKSGIRSWGDLTHQRQLKAATDLQREYLLSSSDAVWCGDRAIADFSKLRVPSRALLLPNQLCFLVGEALKQYRLKGGVEEVLKKKINKRWNFFWSSKQWGYRFKCLWAYPTANKHSTLLWLIIHNGVWGGVRACKAGVSDGMCLRCTSHLEDCPHIWFSCRLNKEVIDMLQLIFSLVIARPLGVQELLLGDAKGLDVPLWNIWRGNILWDIWLQRNAAVFKQEASYPMRPTKHDLRISAHKLISTAPSADVSATSLQKACEW